MRTMVLTLLAALLWPAWPLCAQQSAPASAPTAAAPAPKPAPPAAPAAPAAPAPAPSPSPTAPAAPAPKPAAAPVPAAPAAPAPSPTAPAVPPPASAPAAAPAAAGSQTPAASAHPPHVTAAVAKGVAFLRTQQQTDGSIADTTTTTATTALAALGLLAVGHLPDDPTPEGECLAKALAFLLRDDRWDPQTGYFGAADNSRMYGHGIVTLLLAEIYGMGADTPPDALVRQRLDKAIALILAAQTRKPADSAGFGGWRYLPDAPDADLSVTVWQVMALRAAHNAGIEIPKKAIADAVRYLKSCYRSPRLADGTPENLKSGFAYQAPGEPSYAMASAGLLALQVCGEYTAPEVRGTADWLLDCQPDPKNNYFFYGTYYFAQGLYQCGDKYATYAEKSVYALLPDRQNPDGSWQAPGGSEQQAGRVYTTAMALLSLSVGYRYLPIYQR